MKLIKQHKLVENPWTLIADDSPLLEGPIIVSVARWNTEKEALSHHSELGICVGAQDLLEELAQDLTQFKLVQLHFEKFNDGRSFSQARWLKERFNFSGEIRVSGAFIQDQILALARLGVDSFLVPDDFSLATFEASMNEISVQYQSSVVEPRPLFLRR